MSDGVGPAAPGCRPGRCPRRRTARDVPAPRGGGGPAPRAGQPRPASTAGTSPRSPASEQPDGQLRDGALPRLDGDRAGSATADHLHGICQDLTDVGAAPRGLAPRRSSASARCSSAPRSGSPWWRATGASPSPTRRWARSSGGSREELLELPRVGPRHPSRRTCPGDGRRAAADGRGRAARVERREALRAAERGDPHRRPAGTAPLRRRGPAPAPRWRSCATSPSSAWPSGAASALHGVARIMGSGAPLSEALPALVETVVGELGCDRGSLWLHDGTGGPARAAWRSRLPAARRGGRPRCPSRPPPSGRDRRPRDERRRHDRPARARRAERPRSLDDDLGGFAQALGVQVGEFVVRKRAEELLLPPGAARPAHRPAQPRAPLRPPRPRAPAAQREQPRSPCSFSTSTASRPSTTASARRRRPAPRLAADRLVAAMRAADTVARFGGDELAVLSSTSPGKRAAPRSRSGSSSSWRRPIDVHGEEVVLSASIGICVAPIEGATPRRAAAHTPTRRCTRPRPAAQGRYVIAAD